MNLGFLFEIEYNDSCGKFALIIVFNLELSIWTVWGDSHFYGRFLRRGLVSFIKFDEISVECISYCSPGAYMIVVKLMSLLSCCVLGN